MCPRVKKNRLQIDPESLIPRLPDIKDLRPYPNVLALTYGHERAQNTDKMPTMRCVDVDPSGHWAISGSDDGCLRLWEILTGRCVHVFNVGDDPVTSCSWNPNKDLSLVAACSGSAVVLLSLYVASPDKVSYTDGLVGSVSSSASGRDTFMMRIVYMQHALSTKTRAL